MTRSRALLVAGAAALLALGASTAGPPDPVRPAAPVRSTRPGHAASPGHQNIPFPGYPVKPVPRDGTTVRVTLNPITPTTVETDQCPYTFRATLVGFRSDITVELSVVGGATAHSVLHLTCGATPSTPVGAVDRGPCPYVTAFTATLLAAYPQRVSYEWRLDDGEVRTGTVHLNAGQPVAVTLPHVVVWTGHLYRDYRVALRVTSPGGGTATGTVRCGTIRR